MTSTRVAHETLVSMLRNAAREAGLDLRELYELGTAGRLDDPTLRDLWLIWGDVLNEGDLPSAA